MFNFRGQSIGRYQVLDQLGVGGMAVVYKAFDTHLECNVAIKFLRTDQLAPTILEKALKRFEREAKTIAQLNHPNIIKVTDYGEYQDIPYLVMTYVPGGTLKQLLGKPLPFQKAARLLLPIADALQYAHEHNVIHRDVKPANILISESGTPMLTDFGVAKILDVQDGHTLTATGVGIGTPEYMAPEQGLGKTVDARSDIYSLGVVLYELVTGHKPYTADTPMAVILKQSTEPLPKPSSFVSNLPEQVDQVLFKALNKSPENRYQTMREFITALGLLANSSPPPATKPLRKNQVASTDNSATGDNVESELGKDTRKVAEDKPRNKKQMGLLWLGIGFIIIAGVLYLFTTFSFPGFSIFPFPSNTPIRTVTLAPSKTTTSIQLKTPTPTRKPTLTKTSIPTRTLMPTVAPTKVTNVKLYIWNQTGTPISIYLDGKFLFKEDASKSLYTITSWGDHILQICSITGIYNTLTCSQSARIFIDINTSTYTHTFR